MHEISSYQYCVITFRQDNRSFLWCRKSWLYGSLVQSVSDRLSLWSPSDIWRGMAEDWWWQRLEGNSALIYLSDIREECLCLCALLYIKLLSKQTSRRTFICQWSILCDCISLLRIELQWQFIGCHHTQSLSLEAFFFKPCIIVIPYYYSSLD